jgi:hypothetical protein
MGELQPPHEASEQETMTDLRPLAAAVRGLLKRLLRRLPSPPKGELRAGGSGNPDVQLECELFQDQLYEDVNLPVCFGGDVYVVVCQAGCLALCSWPCHKFDMNFLIGLFT